ncbi:unnamed protein product [Rotaria socialis]|uniref:GTPase n=1 Tax=Rotaria socialis TaxID=392032 RepID=A0A821EFD4_9BILA|nr:unnamed protein product [Rotaria socialis]CAF4635030.1 unnamed protein product [Rotaria socialis]
MAINTHVSTDQPAALSRDRLLFVYNADSGFLNMLKDLTHKIVSPSTYDCQLCALTYGNTGMRKKWHTFISNLSFDTIFLHRDELGKQYPSLINTPLPCIFLEKKIDKSVQLILDAETINKQQTLDQLIAVCSRSIDTHIEP